MSWRKLECGSSRATHRSRNPFHRHLPLNLQKQDHAEINSYTTSLDVTGRKGSAFESLLTAPRIAPQATAFARLGLDVPDITATDAIAAITRTTAGDFRLVTRLLNRAERVMKLNELDRVTAEVIDAARDALVIGTH